MDTGFREFPQTPRGRDFSLLGFIPSFKYLQMFELNEAVRGRLIGPKTWDLIVWIYAHGLFGCLMV